MDNGTARQYIKTTEGVDLLKFVSASSPLCICHFVLQSHFGTVDKSPICKVSGIANGLSFMHQKAVAHGDLRGVGLQSFLRFWSR